MRSEKELQALVTLLGDEEEHVAAVAWDTLIAEGEAAIPWLTEATQSPEPLLRGRSRVLLEELRRTALEAEWEAFTALPEAELDLERGCLLLARLAGHEHTDSVSRFLDAIAGMVRAHMATAGGAPALGEVLFGNLGFKGGDFRNIESHYLPTVLDRRSGIPISLAAVYVLVGRRAGLPVSGAAMPGHYLARYDQPEGPVFIDCYNQGRTLTTQTLINVLESKGLAFSERLLDPCSARFTLYRMLNNLEAFYLDLNDARTAQRVARLRDGLKVG